MPDPVQINVDHASDDENVPEASTATSGVERKKRRSPSLSVTVSQAPDDRTSKSDTGSPGQSSAGKGDTRPTMTINTTTRPRERSLSASNAGVVVMEDGRVSPRGSRANSTANSPSNSPLPSPGHSPRLKAVVVRGPSTTATAEETSTGGLLLPGLHKTSSRGDTSPGYPRRGSGSSDRAPEEFHD